MNNLNFNNKKVLTTGGSEYFGSVLVRYLQNFNTNVCIFDQNKADTDIKFLKGDIRDKKKLIKDCNKIDITFHYAANMPLALRNIEYNFFCNEEG